MATVLERIAAEMARRDAAFAKKVEVYERELFDIFDQAEKYLYAERERFLRGMVVDNAGRIVGGTEAIGRIDQQVSDIRQALTSEMVEPARSWADRAITDGFRGGRTLARANVSFGLIDFDAVSAAFRNVTDAEAGVLRVGLRDTYDILNTVGDDIAQFFRGELTRATTLGLPIQGPGSLSERLFQSGRIKPLTIRTKEGKLIQRTVRQRAVTIARVETAKVYNEAHQVKSREVFGEEALFKNVNPLDHRTTDICVEASRQPPMTLQAWTASKWGLPPRLQPQFHLCRSHMVGGTREMFKKYG